MSGPAKPVAVYLRVSTDDQSHESQRLEVGRWLAREGIDPARVEWYEDTVSGRRSDRAALDRLKADVRAGKRKTVVCYALDRLSRDFFDGIKLLGGLLKAGARVASVTEPLDLAGELGQALAGVLFALGAIEWKKRAGRQKAGIEVARASGAYKGRKRGAVKGGERAGKPARARELTAKGMSGAEVAQALGVSRRSVVRWLACDGETSTGKGGS